MPDQLNNLTTMNNSRNEDRGLKPQRIQALADGVFAIAMTLLVLDLKGTPSAGMDFWQQFQPLLPKFMTYAVSFLILGVY